MTEGGGKKERTGLIQSLARGIEILSILEQRGSATVSEIAEELCVDKSTASRLMFTLRHYDIVRLDSSNKKYRLGFRLLTLSDGVRRTLDVAMVARPHMYKLCETVHESVHLAATSNDVIYIIDQIRSKREYNLSAHIGMMEPWHASSVGKCILAYRSKDYLEMILEQNGMPGYTGNTITTKEKLEEAVAQIRKSGFAIDDEERNMGVRCIAAPIFNYRGNVNYSLGISGPVSNITQSNIQKYVQSVVDCCRRISDELGYRLFRK